MSRLYPDFIAKPSDPAEIEARIAELRAELHPPVVYSDPAELARAEQARIAECERRQARAEIEARLRNLPFSPIDPGSPLAAVPPKPVIARPTTTPREPQPMTAAAATEADPPPPPPTKPLTDRQREIIATAERLDAAGVTPTCTAIGRELGITGQAAQNTILKLRSRGHWRWEGASGKPRGRPPGPRLATATATPTAPPAPTAPPRPAPSPPTPRTAAPTHDSTTDATERVLGHSGGLPGHATQSDPLVLGLLMGTLSAALNNLGPHLSDRNRLALEMCLEVLR